MVLVKLELLCLFLAHECQVESDAYDIALHTVIVLIGVIVNDVLLTIRCACGNILEVIEVERVVKNIVAVNTLK